jgi:hypothetical protein
MSSHKIVIGRPMFHFSSFMQHWKGKGENDNQKGRITQEREKNRRGEKI